jgi:hypothetical protein
MNTPDPQLVGIDILDAAELAHICRYLTAWITHAPPAVTASLARFGASAEAPATLLDALRHHGDLLERLVPSTSPTHITVTAPLGPGEATGLAEFLIDLAINGWPSDPAHDEAIQHDCRRWALRMIHIPGVIPAAQPGQDTVEDMSTTQSPATARPPSQQL